MDVNERIARALGATEEQFYIGGDGTEDDPWIPAGEPRLVLPGDTPAFMRIAPDYAHSLDACLPVLADKEKDGWQWQAGGAVYPREGSNSEIEFKFWAVIMVPGQRDITSYGRADSPAAALAECLAEALERGAVTFPRASTADKEKAR